MKLREMALIAARNRAQALQRMSAAERHDVLRTAQGTRQGLFIVLALGIVATATLLWAALRTLFSG